MSQLDTLQRAINRGIQFIAAQQRADGGFSSLSSIHRRTFIDAIVCETNFVPALILSCLACVDTKDCLVIRNKLANFLLSERSEHWSYNYWSRSSSMRRTQPYPDDLDDTFCILSALFLHDSSLVDEAALAHVVRLLIATETRPGGPYRTWLVESNKNREWVDADLAVNANIAYFLSLVSTPLPNLTMQMQKALQTKQLRSPYYPNAYAPAYYIARALNASGAPRSLATWRTLLRASAAPLEYALSMSSLIRSGSVIGLKIVVAKLLRAQAKDGSWPTAAFCIDPDQHGKQAYNGCAALTTAFVIEALQLYQQALDVQPQKRIKQQAQKNILPKKIRSVALRWAEHLPKQLTDDMSRELAQTTHGQVGGEILTIGMRFNESLRHPLKKYPTDFFVTLGLANLHGWLAYTIYDDFLDDNGKPRLLSVANVAHRESLFTFSSALPKCAEFQSIVKRTFDAIDNANAWEVKYCRFPVRDKTIIVRDLPDYGRLEKLAERSLGHTLTPLAVLYAKGLHASTSPFRAVQRALKHYLITRQLNDDLHDWQEDLASGHITYVVCKILQESKVRSGSHSLRELMPGLQRVFWYQALEKICQVMQHHISLSRRALGQAAILEPENIVSILLSNIEASIATTLQQRHSAERFLQSYQASKP